MLLLRVSVGSRNFFSHAISDLKAPISLRGAAALSRFWLFV